MTSSKNDIKLEIIQKSISTAIDFYRVISIAQLELPDLCAFFTGISSPYLNVAIDTRKIKKIDNLDVQTIFNFFDHHHLPWGWFVTEISETESLENLGFTLIDQEPKMYFDLHHPLPEITIPDFRVNEANHNLEQWVEPLRESFPSKDKCEAYRILHEKLLQSGQKKLRHYIALYKDEIAACGTLFLSDDSIMLHNLATKHKFRKQRIATQLTIYMMSVAKKLGYQHCFLDASEEGFTLYQRLGFQVCGTTSVYQFSSISKDPDEL